MKVLIVNCFDTYEHRANLLYDFFKKRGDEIKVYASNFSHFEKKTRDNPRLDFTYVRVSPYYKNISVSRLWSHYKFAKDVFRRVKDEKYDLLWVFIPPNSLVKEAVKYKRKHPKAKLVFDVIDMWPETMPIEKIKKLPIVQMWKRLRDCWIDKADFVVTECDLFQKELCSNVKKNKMETVYLSREISTFTVAPKLTDDAISLCYLGSINNIIDIPAIVNVIKILGKVKPIVLHVIGDGEKRDSLLSESIAAGAEVVFHGKIFNREEKQRIFDMCHYGLNIMKSSVYVGLTMKSIDYFEAGLPIINNIHGDTWDIVEKFRIGVNLDKIEMVNQMSNIEMRKATRAFFIDKFGLETFEKSIEYILNECLDEVG